MLLPLRLLGGRFSSASLLAHAVVSTLLGIGCGMLLFPGEASLIGVVLVAFSQAPLVEGLLDRNRDEVWSGTISAVRANVRLANAMLLLFVGVSFTYVLAVQLASPDALEDWFGRQLGAFAGGSMLDVRFRSFGALMKHNGVVFVGCFLFAFIYRHGGMLLVLAWNASRWGVIFSFVARTAAERDEASAIGYLGKTMVVVLPHFLAEAAAYVLIAMSGVFLSRGMARYRLGSAELARVGKAVLSIAVVAALVLTLGAALEANLAPRLVELIFGTGSG